ncbi:hypothetical protein M885DRAFT_534365 [Pelagophyceae sp. CCMP2097]|nr:hypothetical protein M885DRAFT_534365 [Pelagophyceae sp. CCMP2097]
MRLAVLWIACARAVESPCAGESPATCRVVCADFANWVGPSGWSCEEQLNERGREVAYTLVSASGVSAKSACCTLGGGRKVAVLDRAPVMDANVAAMALWVPSECRKFVVRDFVALESLLGQNKSASLGANGGHWSACTHMKIYGFNFAVFLARWLAWGLRPRSVLEFGCGLGTTSSFLARHVPGGTKVVCIEPEPMLREVFENPSHPPSQRPLQLAVDVFNRGAEADCARALSSQARADKFELVLSLEVAEHMAAERIPALIDFLAASTGRYLVFSAARPRQGGTGHVKGSMFETPWWIDAFTKAGLHLLPSLTQSLRNAALPERANLYTNIIALGVPGVEDRHDVPPEVGGCEIYTSRRCRGQLRGQDTANKVDKVRKFWMDGQVQALWPELDIVNRRLKKGEISCL